MVIMTEESKDVMKLCAVLACVFFLLSFLQ
jgi:hypothetical protein